MNHIICVIMTYPISWNWVLISQQYYVNRFGALAENDLGPFVDIGSFIETMFKSDFISAFFYPEKV